MNPYLVFILFVLIGSYLLNLVVERLNLGNLSTEIPAEFAGYYDAGKYRKSQNYLKENTQFEIFSSTIFLAITLAFILCGGFNLVDKFARSFNLGSIPTGLVFVGILLFGSQILHIPFSVYDTFVIEEKYGFNRTTLKTFILDIVKSWLLIVILGGIAFTGVLWFFGWAGNMAWVYCWAAVTLFQIFLMFIAPVLIFPLFNKFTQLEEGELRKAIEDYAGSQDFKMKGVFKMDGSKRSTKSNAFFTGLGRFRRIVLYDTLIEKLAPDEVVSVLAHETGHYKKRHTLKTVFISIVITGVMFLMLSFFIENPGLFSAFKMEKTSVYASLLFFGFLFEPINMILSVALNIMLRKHEYQADAYAVSTYRRPEAMITALKKMSVDDLSNLTPHPVKVFLEYSHPPALERIQVIREMAGKGLRAV